MTDQTHRQRSGPRYRSGRRHGGTPSLDPPGGRRRCGRGRGRGRRRRRCRCRAADAGGDQGGNLILGEENTATQSTEVSTTTGIGLIGNTTDGTSPGIGVVGSNKASAGTGVYGTAAGTGVHGVSNFVNSGLAGTTTAGVLGDSASVAGVAGFSSGAEGVTGTSNATTSVGVRGVDQSTTGTSGVHGISAAGSGVTGIADRDSGMPPARWPTVGDSDSAPGVVGASMPPTVSPASPRAGTTAGSRGIDRARTVATACREPPRRKAGVYGTSLGTGWAPRSGHRRLRSWSSSDRLLARELPDNSAQAALPDLAVPGMTA